MANDNRKAVSALRRRAAAAWEELAGAGQEPGDVQVICTTGKTAVFRLTGLGGSERSVIAKKSPSRAAAFERSIYALLAELSVGALRCLGSVADAEPGFDWLFLEDGGAHCLEPDSRRDRVLVSSWLASLHLAGQGLAGDDRLPGRGAAWHLAHLASAHEMLSAALARRSLDDAQRRLLKSLLVRLDAIEARRDELNRRCREAPATFLHGDLKPQNLLIRATKGSREVVPCDWEMAGYGPVAADLGAWSPGVDPDVYASLVGPHWPTCDRRRVQGFVELGRLLRLIDGMYWAAVDLEWPRKETPMWMLKHIDKEIPYAMRGVL